MAENTKTAKPSYPECEKLAKVANQSQTCGDFLSWLATDKEIVLAGYRESSGDYAESLYPYQYNTEHLLAEFFGVDMKKVETERQALIDSLR